jgi:hypothetical protein
VQVNAVKLPAGGDDDPMQIELVAIAAIESILANSGMQKGLPSPKFLCNRVVAMSSIFAEY